MKAIGLVRLTKDPEVRYSQGDNSSATARFSVAARRRFPVNGVDVDFLNCVAFGKTAEVVEKFLKKGSLIEIIGHIQTGNYTNKDGQKIYTTDIVVDEFEFAGSKDNSDGAKPSSQVTGNEDFMKIDDSLEETLPFM